jgi:hypothetical protein
VLERYKRRRLELAEEAGDPNELRTQLEALTERRAAIWSSLPRSNGDREELRDELDQLEREIASGWDAVRTAEAVAA